MAVLKFSPMSAMAASIAVAVFAAGASAAYTEYEVEMKVKNLLSQMTAAEKIQMLSGTGNGSYIGYIKPVSRLGIPPLRLTDGPVGVRRGQSTAFPASIAMASTWDTALIQKIGEALGRETRAKGQDVLLGPCINILRVPQGGRSFEGFGEDPYLVSRMTVPYIKGVQSQGVIADAKHFALNNQEEQRGSISSEVDERTMMEIYLPAFKAAVQEAGVWSVMAAYNKLNGTYCSENGYLLNDILKKEWGFKGFVVSDWGAVHSTIRSANGGLDMEMPSAAYWGQKLLAAVDKGSVSQQVIDDKVSRILRAMISVGLLDNPPAVPTGVVNSKEHRAIALDAARNGIVLLKNKGILPLNSKKVKSIAVIGPNAAAARHGGGGSSYVSPYSAISPLDALTERAKKDRIKVTYDIGTDISSASSSIDASALTELTAEYFNNANMKGSPVLKRREKQIDNNWGSDSPAAVVNTDGFSARWKGKLKVPVSGEYNLTVTGDDGYRLYVDGKRVVDNWADHATETQSALVRLDAAKTYDIRLEYYENGGLAEIRLGWVIPGKNVFSNAIKIAGEADVAVVFAGLSAAMEGEGADRKDLNLPGLQDDLIQAVAKANKNTIVVLNNGAPVLMDKWAEKAAGILEAWYPGQEGGTAVAEILFGDVNPSGKLPVSFPKKWSDCAAYGSYPGNNGKVKYSEGIFVGYRHFDEEKIEPLFPFGFGLSYTTFDYKNLKITPGEKVKVTLNLKNTGALEGAEVVQLYVRDVESSVPRPIKELKAFKKVGLKPGESREVRFELDRSALAFYDSGTRKWVVEPGKFEILVGSSSRDIKLTGDFEVK